MNTKTKKARYCVIIGTKKFYFETVTDAAALVRKYGAFAKLEFLPTAYQKGKENARREAITWQNNFAVKAHTEWELIDACAYFEKLAQRFGLVREFRENGII